MRNKTKNETTSWWEMFKIIKIYSPVFNLDLNLSCIYKKTEKNIELHENKWEKAYWSEKAKEL